MDVLIADLHEATPALVQQLARQQQPVPEIRKVRVNAEFPGVPKGANLLRLAGQVLVLAVGDLAPVHEGLEVGAVADAVGRVEVDRLHLPAKALLLDQAVHDQQTVARNQAIGPVVTVTVELDGLAERRVFLRRGEQRHLRLRAVSLAHRLNNRARVDALVHVQRHGRHLERRMLRLAGPRELRVQVRVVGIGPAARVAVGLRCNQANGRVVDALLIGMRVGFNVPFRHPSFSPFTRLEQRAIKAALQRITTG